MWLWFSVALAGQVDRWVVDEGGERRYHVVWEDAEGRRTDTTWEVPVAAVDADALADEQLGRAEVNGARAAAVRRWAGTLPSGSSVAVREEGGALRYTVRARDAEARARLIDDARAAARTGADELFAAVGRVRGEDGLYRVDLAALVTAYAPAVATLARALTEPGDDAEDFAARALTFVQSVPYEARRETTWGEPVLGEDGDTFGSTETVGYVAFRRPLSLLDTNKGDCDGKTVLYLALLRAAWPEVALAAARIPGHVYGGVALDVSEGARFTVDGVRYLVVEPTGPGLLGLGTYQKRSVGAPRTVYTIAP